MKSKLEKLARVWISLIFGLFMLVIVGVPLGVIIAANIIDWHVGLLVDAGLLVIGVTGLALYITGDL